MLVAAVAFGRSLHLVAAKRIFLRRKGGRQALLESEALPDLFDLLVVISKHVLQPSSEVFPEAGELRGIRKKSGPPSAGLRVVSGC